MTDLRDKIVGVLNIEGAFCGECSREPGEPLSECGSCYEVLNRYARAVLQAADAVVTVEQIRDEIAGHPLGIGYYQTTLSIYEAQEIAESVHALLTGGEA